MPAISARQPWAEMIVKGIKPFEIRSWAPPAHYIGKRILIHASKTIGKDIPDEVTRIISNFHLYRGAIIGSAVLAGYREYNDYAQWVIDQHLHWNELDWYEKGKIGFVFEEAIEFEQPIIYPGALNFFEVDLNGLTVSGNQNRTLPLGL